MDGQGVGAAVTAAREAMAAVRSLRLPALSALELRVLTDELQSLSARTEAGLLRVVRAVDTRPEVVPQATASHAATELLKVRRVSPRQAALDARVARAADPDTGLLPLLGEAFAAGRVWRGHLDVAVRALDRIPKRLLTKVASDGLSGSQRIDSWLVEQAMVFPPSDLQVLVEHLLDVLDPDGTDRRDTEAFARRRVHGGFDPTGMFSGTLLLDPEGGLAFDAVMALLGGPRPPATAVSDKGELVEHRDTRTKGQRQADALIELCQGELARRRGRPGQSGAAASNPVSNPVSNPADQPRPSMPERGQSAAGEPQGDQPRREAPARRPGDAAPAGCDPPGPAEMVNGDGCSGGAFAGRAPAMVLLTADLAQLAGDPTAGLATCQLSGPVSRATLRRLSCDADFRRVATSPSGAVLDLGRTVRLATRSQRLAVTARDGHCLIPGCGVPVAFCDLHHVRHWADGGPTDLQNLAPLCPRHHTAVHAGQWSVIVRDGLPWVIPPPYVDALRRPVRNPLADAVRTVLRVGQEVAAAARDPLDAPARAPDDPEDPGGSNDRTVRSAA